MANDATLQILIKARNEAKAEFDKLNKQVNDLQGKSTNDGLKGLASKFKDVTGMSLGFASAAGAAGFALQKVIQFMRQAVDETEKYTTRMMDGAKITGMAVDQYSRLVQAADDVFLSEEKLNAGLQAAARQGIDISINGIKKLSQQYNSLGTSQEKARFTAQNFGRAGLEMYKVLELNSDGIDKAMSEVNKSLVVTQQSMNNIINYKRSVDNLTDSWQGFKYTVGNAVIPQLDLLMRQLTAGIDPVEETEIAVNALNEQIQNLTKYGGMAGLSQEEIAKQIAAANAEIQRLTTSTNKQVESQKFLEASTISATMYFKELTKEMLFNLAAEGLDSDQALRLAESMGLVDSATRAQIEAVQLLRAEYADTGNLDAYLGKMGSLASMLQYINSMSNVNINWGGSGYGGYGTSDVNYQNGGKQTVVNVTYSPAVSLTDKTEVVKKLKPLIQQAMRE